MKDYIGKCPLTQMDESCYITPINEKYNAYKSLLTGFESTDFWKDGEFDIEELESTLPELYKDIKQVDSENRIWYPSIILQQGIGIVFVVGTNNDDWQWAAMKHIPVLNEEKERFKHPKTGEYIHFKDDPSSLKMFGQEGYIEALDYIGLLN